MLQTLVHIPHTLGPLPVFGFGWALLAWTLAAVGWLVLLARNPQTRSELASAIPLMLTIGVVLAFVIPLLEDRNTAGESLGLAIRGYGVMLLLAIIASVGLAAYRARRLGLDPEIIMSLAFWMLVAGIVGARLFYVVQKWEQFQRPTLQETVFALFDFVEGGLVVYGSAIGAILAIVIFCYRRKLPVLAIADLVAPSMMVGLAIGRIGCLLNGCCYGGACTIPQLAVTFPPEAPAYYDQLTSGTLLGFHLAAKDKQADGRETVYIDHVAPGSLAEEQGLRADDSREIIKLQGQPIENLHDAKRALAEWLHAIQTEAGRSAPLRISLATADGQNFSWPLAELPARSLPIHPTQIYSAVDAALLAWVLWLFYPFRRRDGEVLALMLTLHPISRFILEEIRTDEAGIWGTRFTISQLVGFLFLIAAAALWYSIERRPRGTALPAASLNREPTASAG